MKAKSMKVGSTEAIKSALAESMADGFKPTLAVVFFPSVKTEPPFVKYWMRQALLFMAPPLKENL